MMMREGEPILCLLVLGLTILTLLVAPVAAAKLATPVLIVPPNNFQSYDIDGTTLFTWKPVPGATHYWFEIQHKLGTDWVDTGSTNLIAPHAWWWYEPSVYRWRVTANNTNPADSSTPTAWRTLIITDTSKSMKLATPIPVGPAVGITFYHTIRDIVVYWKPVFGADQYVLLFQYYDPIVKTWIVAHDPFTITGTQHTALRYSYPPEIVAPFQGRWSVMACDTTKTWMNSTPSAWRTFTFKN